MSGTHKSSNKQRAFIDDTDDKNDKINKAPKQFGALVYVLEATRVL